MKGTSYDVVMAGGGPAGLSAAVALSRVRRSVLVVDAGVPRNAPRGHVHNYLGREGVSPADLLADGQAAVAGYGGEVVVQVLELIPPAVRTALMGQEDNEASMPLHEFLSAVMTILRTRTEVTEIVVERAEFLRHAEAAGTYQQTLRMLSGLPTG